MTVAEEVKKRAAEQTTAAAKSVKEKKAAKVAPKEKKAKTAKSAKTASHPPYFEMIKEALLALNEKGGSSPYAIAKYMEEKHKAVLPANFRKILGLQLKNSATKGKLNKIKASYKLSDSGKKAAPAAKPAAKKPSVAAGKKPRAAKAAAPAAGAAGTKRKADAVKKVAAKKGVKKAATPVKAKQPKSIKSPAAKRARRAAAAV